MIFNKPYIPFGTAIERDNLSQNPRKEKIFYYKGRDVSEPTVCEILGYENEYEACATLVIDYGKGICFINSDYLKQMQNSKFSVDNYEEA